MRPTNEEPSEDIDVPMLKTWLEQGMAVLVDVREPAEHAKERIPGACLRPLSTFVPAQVPQEPGKRLVLHCVMGARSAQACQKMREAGVTRVYNLQGGLQAWKAAGYRTESAALATISPQRQGPGGCGRAGAARHRMRCFRVPMVSPAEWLGRCWTGVCGDYWHHGSGHSPGQATREAARVRQIEALVAAA